DSDKAEEAPAALPAGDRPERAERGQGAQQDGDSGDLEGERRLEAADVRVIQPVTHGTFSVVQVRASSACLTNRVFWGCGFLTAGAGGRCPAAPVPAIPDRVGACFARYGSSHSRSPPVTTLLTLLFVLPLGQGRSPAPKAAGPFPDKN